MSTHPASAPAGRFRTTQWSLVVSAGRADDTASRQALEALCEKYWPTLYGYVRRRGHSVEDANDLTQEFFLRLLERNWIAQADPSKGRFRSFLLTVLKRFLADEWHKGRTLKRGGNIRLESLSEMAEAKYSTQLTATTGMPDLDFERDWAFTLLGNVLTALQHDYTSRGQGALFASLRHYLAGSHEQQPYAAAAAQLDLSEDAFKMAVSRLRQRYREKMRAEVAATVASPSDVDAEVRHLCRILAKTR